MSIEINSVLKATELQQLIIHVFSPYLKGSTTTTIHPYLLGEKYSRIPFWHACVQGHKPPTIGYARAKYKFVGQLRREQVSIVRMAFEILARASCLLLSTHVGFGKTILAIYALSELGLKTFIVCNRKVLLDQWYESICTFIEDARAVILSAGDKLDYDQYDIFIINAVNLPKMSDRLDKVGVLIVDEVHLLLSQKMSQYLLYFTPRYLIGLSATPYRNDGSNKLFDLFFGNNIVFKPLLRSHIVYKVSTSFRPKMEQNARGKLNWDSILSQQAENIERNELVLKVVQQFSSLKFIILCKRVLQIQLLNDLFERAQIPVYALYGNAVLDRAQLKDKRAIVGTFSKLGVGFDDKSATALILASDVEEYFIQYLGRVFRNPEVEPIIFDFVDDCNVLRKHFQAREQVYVSAGMKMLVPLKLH